MSDASRAADVRVGVAGWDYPDWEGTVYPSGDAARRDRLAYLSRYVDVVEVNSTFYRPVPPRTAASWVRRTRSRAGFRFTAKAHRSWTHEPGEDLAEAVAETLAGLAPLRDAGILGAVLAQFPQSFHRTRRSLERLDRLADLAEGWPVVVEVRHASWTDPEIEEWLRDRGVGWCVVDQPIVGRSSLRPFARATSNIGYVRLHGRNTVDWFREDAGRDARYDYMYTLDELRPLAELARDIAGQVAQTYVIQNNHFRGQALANALQMRHLVSGDLPAAPAELVSAYPVLEDLVSKIEGTRRLF